MRAGIVDGSWLPRTARAVAHLMSQVTLREAEATGRELMRLPYSRSSIERVGHAVGAEYLSRREHVEPKLIEACELIPIPWTMKPLDSAECKVEFLDDGRMHLSASITQGRRGGSCPTMTCSCGNRS
ncbi:MAG TPA: hypothetical protein VJU53_02780 [Burkholderiaceae bacterium]|nr:hypothetical protein [Burkholderiaceae bacterium]